MDKTSLALDESLQTVSGAQQRTLFVTWNDQGNDATCSGKVRPTKTWLAAVPLEPYTGGMFAAPTPTEVPAPIYFVTSIGPHVPFYQGPCTNPTPGRNFVDDVGRGNLWATNYGASGGTDYRLYYTFSNVTGPDHVVATRRIYVERLDPPNQYIACIDQFDASTFASQGQAEEHDPQMVYDPPTDTVAVVYARPDVQGRQRITLAGGSGDGTTWTFRDVNPVDSAGDESQPAIALTHYTDVLDRVFSGTIMVTWYADAGDGQVFRAARGFLPFTSHNWGATSVVLTTSTPPFAPLSGTFDLFSNRGVLEYQGVTHLPGYASARVSNAGGGWLGVWGQPFHNVDTPSDADQTAFWTRWP